MKKLLFVMPSLDSGGAEKSLVNLLNIIDYTHYNVDLLLLKQEGLFLNQIPKEVNILPVVDALHYAYKIDKYVFHSFASIKSGLLRIMSTFICKLFYKKNSRQQRWLKFYKRYLPNLENNYDVAIGFLEGDASYYVIDKVHAIKKYYGFIMILMKLRKTRMQMFMKLILKKQTLLLQFLKSA